MEQIKSILEHKPETISKCQVVLLWRGSFPKQNGKYQHAHKVESGNRSIVAHENSIEKFFVLHLKIFNRCGATASGAITFGKVQVSKKKVVTIKCFLDDSVVAYPKTHISLGLFPVSVEKSKMATTPLHDVVTRSHQEAKFWGM